MERNVLYREAGDTGNKNATDLNAYESPAGYFSAPLWQYDAPPLQKDPGVSQKIDEEEDANGYTCYAAIDLQMRQADRALTYGCKKFKTDENGNEVLKNGKKVCVEKDYSKPTSFVQQTKNENLTAVFAPPAFTTNGTTDLIIYLHGHLTGIPGLISHSGKKYSPDIKQYLNYKTKPYFHLRELIKASGKNIILAAPTLGPLSQYGTLVKNFDQYVNQVIAAVNNCIVSKKNLKGEFKPGRLIIAAHSGGGSPMQRILQLGSKYAKMINEVWGFDSWYNSSNAWKDIAQQNPDLKIYGYYFDSQKIPNKPGGQQKRAQSKNFYTIRVAADAPLKDHFTLLPHYFKERLLDTVAVNDKKTSNQTAPQKNIPPVSAHTNTASNADYKLTPLKLGNDAIVVGKYAETVKVNGKRKVVTRAVVKEVPADFLPEIVRRALGDKGKDWFNKFTRITFLGRKLKSHTKKQDGKKVIVEQFIHIEFAKKLKEIEKQFAAVYGGPGKDPVKAGDFLLGKYEALSGSRETSSTATFSMHMFGLAIDVNYMRNPFIEKKDIALVNKVLERAGWLIDGNKPQLYFHGMKYDGISKLDKLLEKYFDLMDNPVALQEKINASPGGSPWKNKSLSDAQKIIDSDLTSIATKLARGSNRDVIKKGGILDLPKEFVEGMIAAGLNWGGFYGDMMHFDMRDISVGKLIDNERKKYQAEKNKQAKDEYLNKK